MRHIVLSRCLALLTVLALLAPGVAQAAPSNASTERLIVVLRPGAGDPGAVGAEIGRRHNARLGFVYQHALKGFVLDLPAQAAAAIARDPRVAFVEADQPVRIAAQTTPTGIRRIFADSNPNIDIDGTDDKRVDVDVAVIDTGIDLTHPDLNVAGSVDCAKGGPLNSSCSTGGGQDGNGHGTHVAGTIGALDNGAGVVGVAPGARLWAVRVLGSDGSGWTSWIIAGIDWVTANAKTIEVANMSLGCECSSAAQDQAIATSVAAGVVYAVAAGNSDKDASTFSPANHPDVITVSALADFNGLAGGGAASTCRTDQDDTLADFSNFGKEVEITAPGVCILSTWLNGGYNTISGTSMASPHVAGAAALLASKTNPNDEGDVTSIRDTLVNSGNLNWTDDSGDGIKERLLDVSNTSIFAPALVAGSSGGGTPTDDPPTVSITSPSNGATVSGSDVTVSANASDDNGVKQVEFFVSSASIGSVSLGVDTSSSYQVSWDTIGFADGTYTLTAVATDSADQTTTSAGISVTVSNSTGGGGASITLSATGYKIKGLQKVDLTWSGANSNGVTISRNGQPIASPEGSSGTITDHINRKGGGSYTYKACDKNDASICSNEVTVSF